MSSVVVDTDVVSYFFKRDTRAEAFRPILAGKLPVVSFMTVAELERWAIHKNWGVPRRAKMEEHLRNFVIYPFSQDLCVKWAEATCSADSNGKEISCADAWIAATALLCRIPLVTNNGDDFRGVEGLEVISVPAV